MKKWFSYVLVVALCITALTGAIPTAFADEEETLVAEAVDPQYADTEGELGEALENAGEDDGYQIDAADIDADPVETGDAAELSLDGAFTDVDAPSEAEGDVFTPWYAAALASLTLEMDEVMSCIIPEGSVLLVTGQSGEGLMNVACGTLTGVVDATALAALTEDELGAFMAQIALMDAVTLYDDMPDYPLPPMPVQQADAPAEGEETVPEETIPDENIPEETIPEETIPEENIPEETIPEETPSEKVNPAEEVNPADDAPADDDIGDADDQEAAEAPTDTEEKNEAEAPAETEEKDEAEAPEEIEEKNEAETPAETEEKDEAEAPAETEEKKEAEPPAETEEKKEAEVPAAAEKASAEAAASAESPKSAEAAGEGAETSAATDAAASPKSAEAAGEGAETSAATDAAASAAAPASEAGVPAAIAVNLPAVNMGLKEKFAGLTAVVVDAAGAPVEGAAVNWASSNVRVVRVDAAGKLTAVRKGKATIVIRADGLPEALVSVVVKSAPSKVTLKPKKVHVSVGTTYQLAPKFNKGAASAGLTFTSSDPAVAQVNEAGLVTGVAPGKAFITVRTFNKKKARVRFDVTLYDYPADMVMSAQTVTIGVKEKYQRLGYTLIPPEGKENCEATVKWKSKNTRIAKVNAKTGVITGVKAGTTTILATTNNKITRKVKVVVIKGPKSVVISPKELALNVGATGALTASYNGKTPTDNVTYVSSDPNIATVDAAGVVTAVADGTAVITVSTYNNRKDYCTVTVGEPQVATADVHYRMFAAYNFYNVLERGSLSFPMNNATSFQKALSGSSINGAKYENVGTLENESKDGILSGIAKAFAGSGDTDVNVVYLCSHGTNYVDKASSGSTHYGLQLPGYSDYNSSSAYYITSEELFAAISAIKGKVILVLDSCYSGVFISNMKSALEAEDGRISVMTAANNTKACYYNVTDVNEACDFFTYYMLLGAGYDMQKHTSTGSYPADSNSDGKLTLNEMFAYAKQEVKTNLPNFKNKSWFHGDASQTPCIYEGYNGGLVLFQYA